MKKLLLTILILSTLLCSGCLEQLSSEYRRGYDDGYNNPDEETLECVIEYYNAVADVYNAENDEYLPHAHNCGVGAYGIQYNEILTIEEYEDFRAFDMSELPNHEQAEYCIGYIRGYNSYIRDSAIETKNDKLNTDAIEAREKLDNLSECR